MVCKRAAHSTDPRRREQVEQISTDRYVSDAGYEDERPEDPAPSLFFAGKVTTGWVPPRFVGVALGASGSTLSEIVSSALATDGRCHQGPLPLDDVGERSKRRVCRGRAGGGLKHVRADDDPTRNV